MTTATSDVAIPSFRLDGAAALVTGASAGIGRRFAQVLAASGATVYAVARRAERLEELAAATPQIRPIAADLSEPGERQRVVEIAAADSPIDVLVNNAGIGGPTRIEDESLETISTVLDVNLIAAIDLCQIVGTTAAGEALSIVNVASILGLVAGAPLGGVSYAASKGGLIAMTRELAGQWGRRGIRVNAIAPGWFRTEMTTELFADEKASAWVDRNTMLRRAGESDELDGALLFLASSASRYCTGQVLVVDGGWTAR